MKGFGRTAALWLSVFLIFAILIKAVDQGQKTRKALKFSQFIELVQQGKVAEVTFKSEDVITGNLKEPVDGKTSFETVGDTKNPVFTEILKNNKLIPDYEQAEKTPF